MEFHPQKCQLLRITNKRKIVQANYSIHNHTLEQVDSAKYLGITIHQSLKWNTHISNITKKANSAKAFLQRNLSQCSRKTKTACYEYLVRPLLEYSNTVWDPHSVCCINQLEAVQRRAARFVFKDYSRYSSVTTMLRLLAWPSLAERRARSKAAMMYRIVNNQVAIDPSILLTPASNQNRGHSNRFILPYARTQPYKYSFFPSAVKIWNKLPEDIINKPTLEAFKSALLKVSLDQSS
jgi:hypothetical protein